MNTKLEQTLFTFYFDYLSPYSYLAYQQLKRQKTWNLVQQIKPVPVVLGKIMNHWGQKGPAEIPPKRLYLFRHCLRLAQEAGISLISPPLHPFNSLYALRLSTASANHFDVQQQWSVIDLLWKQCWEQGKSIDQPELIQELLDVQGLPGAALIEASYSTAVKQELIQGTQKAIEVGVFGVPSFVIEKSKELFWGLDAIEHLNASLNQCDPLPADIYQRCADQILKGTPR